MKVDDELKALLLSYKAHAGQVRKSNKQPYILHPAEVANIVSVYGGSSIAIISGWLHDVLEDTKISAARIERMFGSQVLMDITSLTETKLNPDGSKRGWKERKEESIALIPSLTADAAIVKMADIISNLRGLARDGEDNPQIWDMFNVGREESLWYYKESLLMLFKHETLPTSMLIEAWRLYDYVNEHI